MAELLSGSTVGGKIILTADALEDATTTKKGIVMLDDTVTSTSTVKAATPNAVKQAMDRANEAFTQADNGKKVIVPAIGSPAVDTNTFINLANHIYASKGEMATNLVAKGVAATGQETLDALAKKIATIPAASGTKMASGSIMTSTSDATYFTLWDGTTGAYFVLRVGGLTFVPKYILAHYGAGATAVMYDSTTNATWKITSVNSATAIVRFRQEQGAIINAQGFALPILANYGQWWTWIAFG